MTTGPLPQPTTSDDEMVATFGWIAASFCLMLVVVAVAGALFLVPDRVVGVRGLAIGCGLALLAWFLPVATMRVMLASARRSGVRDAGVPAAVRTTIFGGISTAEFPALLALVLVVADGRDVGALVVAVPVAIASLLVNVSGPGAVRRHLDRLRD